MSVRWTWLSVCVVLVLSIRACNLVSIYQINQLWHVCERVLSTIFNLKNFLQFSTDFLQCKYRLVYSCIHSTINNFSIRFIHNFVARVGSQHTHTYELECNRDSMHLMCIKVTKHKPAFVHVCRSLIFISNWNYYSNALCRCDCCCCLANILIL